MLDDCGVCSTDSSNDCIQDCAGVWGGDNFYVDATCGSCSVNLWDECYNIETTSIIVLIDGVIGGEIPPEIGNLTNLSYLYLYNNQLTGEIPSEIGSLTNLTYLLLFNNQLSGAIPEEICNIGSAIPEVEDNQLCPPYPSCITQHDIDSQDTSNCP